MLKLLVIGDMNTGKTSLVNQFVHKKFDSTYKATIACEFALKVLEINGSTVRVQLWDIAGQDRLGGISKLYCRDAVGAVVVSDVTSEDSLKNVLQWKEQVDAHLAMQDGSHIPMVLLSNKYDLVENYKEKEAFMTPSYLDDFAKKNGFVKSFRTSAKMNAGVEEAFLFLINTVLQKDLGGKKEDFDNVYSDNTYNKNAGPGNTGQGFKLSEKGSQPSTASKKSSCC